MGAEKGPLGEQPVLFNHGASSPAPGLSCMTNMGHTERSLHVLRVRSSYSTKLPLPPHYTKDQGLNVLWRKESI